MLDHRLRSCDTEITFWQRLVQLLSLLRKSDHVVQSPLSAVHNFLTLEKIDSTSEHAVEPEGIIDLRN